MISLTVNGKTVEVDGPVPLLDFLAARGVDPRVVAVEWNGEILRRDQFDMVRLEQGDQIEIVHMVGGG